jgi:hypothetical protein
LVKNMKKRNGDDSLESLHQQHRYSVHQVMTSRYRWHSGWVNCVTPFGCTAAN